MPAKTLNVIIIHKDEKMREQLEDFLFRTIIPQMNASLYDRHDILLTPSVETAKLFVEKNGFLPDFVIIAEDFPLQDLDSFQDWLLARNLETTFISGGKNLSPCYQGV